MRAPEPPSTPPGQTSYKPRAAPSFVVRMTWKTDNLQVPTGFDLDLDPLITSVDFFADLVEQDLRRVLNADRNSRGDLTARAAEMFPQRHTEFPRFEVPARSLDRRFRHTMTAHGFHQRKHIARRVDFLTQHH